MTRWLLALVVLAIMNAAELGAEEASNWAIDLGFRFFKYSSEGTPKEIAYNAVFARWERISQTPDAYAVSAYTPLDPLYFNASVGCDVFIRYKRHLLIKVGYDYSNPMGLGGKGDIAYTTLSSGEVITEKKEFSYTSHQLNYFIGPIVPVGPNGVEAYMAFSLMPPTWVKYKEKYTRTVDGATVRHYDRNFDGFFGSCRALFGAHIPITAKIRLGSEAVFSFLNYMELTSGPIKDRSFQFPLMKWDVVLRYAL